MTKLTVPLKRTVDLAPSTQSLDDITDCFPPVGIIRTYMDWAHRTTHAPPIFHLASILPVLAYEAARRGYVLDVEDSQDILLRVWTCIAGSSGAGKGTAMHRAKEFSEAFYTARHQTFEAPPYLALEGSIPGVLAALADRYYDEATERTSAILFHEELSRVLLQESASEALIMLYDGRDYTRNLRSIQKEQKEGEKTNDTIRKPCLSAVFTTPSASLEKASTVQHVAGGLYSRMLWMVGDVTRDKLMFRERKETERLDFALRDWRSWAASLDGHETMGRPRKVHLSHATESILAEGLFDQLRARIAEDSRLQGVYLRLLTHARILAGLFALSRGAHEVELDDMCRAVNLATVCLSHVEELDEQLAVSVGYRLQTRLLEHVRKSGPGGSTKRELYIALKLTKGELENAAEALLDRGDVVVRDVRKGGPGRPSTVFYAKEFAPPQKQGKND
jgi:hypothetical protein